MNKDEMSKEVERIKGLIKNAEFESAKSAGVIENIKKEWKKKYDTDNVEKIKEILDEKREKLNADRKHLETLFNKLENSYDWDNLEEELN